MAAPLSEVLQETSSVFSLFSLIKLHLASHPLPSSYSRLTVPSILCAQNIYILPQVCGAPLIIYMTSLFRQAVLVDKDESKLVAKCEEIKQETGGEVISVVADVAKVRSRLL